MATNNFIVSSLPEYVQELEPVLIDQVSVHGPTIDRIALQTGIKTYKQIAAEVGRDWKSQLDDMAEVKAYAESIGLDIDQILYGKTGGEEVNAEDDTGSGLNPDDEPAEAE